VASKCQDLSQLQFQLQMEKRQAEHLQKQLKQATEDVQNYKRMLESSRYTVVFLMFAFLCCQKNIAVVMY